MEDTSNKPLVALCDWCQSGYPAITAQIKQHKNDYNFSHGICRRHSALLLKKPYDPFEPDPLDLEKHPELVKAYSEGNFSPFNITLKERLQKLSNIKK